MSVTARKYAQAYLNVSGASLSYSDIQLIEQFGVFFKKHKQALLFLRLPLLTDEKKLEGMQVLYQQSPVPQSFQELGSLLLKSRNIELLKDVCGLIGMLYRKKHAIHEISVTSSCALDNEQKKEIEQFIAAHISGTIMCTYTVSDALVAGIRIQTNTMRWEHSIDRQLHAIHRNQRV